VSALDVPLGSIRAALQGIIPTPIATVSADGVPNSTYVSIVWYVDEERIALSNQYLGKTVENLRANRLRKGPNLPSLSPMPSPFGKKSSGPLVAF
jgi:hypothetical protein